MYVVVHRRTWEANQFTWPSPRRPTRTSKDSVAVVVSFSIYFNSYWPPAAPPLSIAFLTFSWSSQRRSEYPAMSAVDWADARCQKQEKWCQWGTFPSNMGDCKEQNKKGLIQFIQCVYREAVVMWDGNLQTSDISVWWFCCGTRLNSDTLETVWDILFEQQSGKSIYFLWFIHL